jgi:hypothetical protein
LGCVIRFLSPQTAGHATRVGSHVCRNCRSGIFEARLRGGLSGDGRGCDRFLLFLSVGRSGRRRRHPNGAPGTTTTTSMVGKRPGLVHLWLRLRCRRGPSSCFCPRNKPPKGQAGACARGLDQGRRRAGGRAGGALSCVVVVVLILPPPYSLLGKMRVGAGSLEKKRPRRVSAAVSVERSRRGGEGGGRRVLFLLLVALVAS